MANFNGCRLGKLLSISVAIATLAACGKTEEPPTAVAPSPIASSVASSSPKVATSPTAPAVAPPVATPVTVAPASPPVNATPAASPKVSPAAPASPVARAGVCKGAEKSLLNVETANYLINICGVTAPEFYVGAEKKDPTKSIRLPLVESSPTFYRAVNGNTTYILAQTPKGKFLTVTQGGQELLREPVKGW